MSSPFTVIEHLIHQEIEHAIEHNRIRLPSIRTLAHKTGTSTPTVQRVIKKCVEKKLIEARSGSGLYIHPSQLPIGFHRPQLKPLQWQNILRTLQKDIVKGKFLQSEKLPPIKELCQNYRTSFKTMKKVLYQLVIDSQLEYDKKCYRIKNTIPERKNSYVILYVRGWDRDQRFATDVIEKIRLLEWHCATRNIQVFIYFFGYKHQKLIPLFNRKLLKKSLDAPLAHILWSYQFPRKEFSQLVDKVYDPRTPLFIWNTDPANLKINTSGKRITFFQQTRDYEAGTIMGKYISQVVKKNATILYLNVLSPSIWSQKRLEGIRAQLMGADITELGSENFLQFFKPEAQLSAKVVDIRKQIIGKHLDMQDTFQRNFAGALNRMLPHLIYGIKEYKLVEETDTLLRAYFDNPNNPIPDAIITCDDRAGVMCVDFLESRGLSIPVAGFDDSFKSSLRNFTSYNFNNLGVIQAIIQNLLDPIKRGEKINTVHIEGFLTIR